MSTTPPRLTAITENYDPVLWAHGLIKADITSILNTWTTWYTRDLGYRLSVHEVLGSFPQILHSLSPLRPISASRVLLVPSRSGSWTATFTNGLPAPDLGSTGVVARRLKADFVLVTNVPAPNPDFRPGFLEGRQFSYNYIDSATGDYNRRYIVATKQSEKRWEFVNQGDLLPFENPDYYTQRILKKRLTPEIQQEYLHALGVHMESPDFFADYGYLIDFVNPRIEN